VRAQSASSGRVAAALTSLSLVLAGCAGGGGVTDPTADPASDPTATATAAPAASAGAGDPPDAASAAPATDAPAGGGDTGAPAAPGEGRLEVGGTTHAFTISECDQRDDGPTKGTVEVRGTTTDGATFAMTQFYLNDKWSQTSVEIDDGSTKIYVIRSGTREGAVPATVDGSNVTWIEQFRELDLAANSQVDLGTGVLNLTCS
jgi:hypothetical protein